MFGIHRFAVLLPLAVAPGMGVFKSLPPTLRASPLCAAYIALDQRWAEERLAANHRLRAGAKRTVDAQVTQEDRQKLCNKPYFSRWNRQYVFQRRKWRRKLSEAYRSLLHRLHGASRRHLIRDERRWKRYHARGLLNPLNSANGYVARVTRLNELARDLSVGPYPFISDHMIIKNTFFSSGASIAHVHYPQFDNGVLGAATANGFFAHAARSAVRRFNRLASQVFSVPLPPGSRFPVAYNLSQWFTLHRPSRTLVDIDLITSQFTGGAGEYGGERSYLFDLRTDKRVSLQQIFRSGSNWRHRLAHIVDRDFQQQFAARGSKYISRQNIVQALRHPTNYFFTREALEIELDYNWPTVHFAVKISYAQIRSLLRQHGLLADAALVAPSGTPH
ncbi:MAG: hypothetical protein ACP5P4_05435 [Steroidobacteraceae bacterium]